MFIQNRAKSIAQRLNAKNIAPLRAKIAEFADKIAGSSAKFDDIISLNAKFKKSSADSADSQNLGENISSLRDSAKQNLDKKSSSLRADSQNLRGNPLCERIAESALDSANPSPSYLSNSHISFAKRAAPPAPLPLRAKKLRFFAFRGRASLSPLLAKNRRSHYCSLESDFLHHEAGEFSGASHGFNVDSANNAFFGTLKSLLLDLKPWRKGPFNICGIEVQSEWDSAIKFNIIAPHLSVEGKVVADIGCNNGYYSFRLLPLRPSKIVCFEPSAHCKMQFDLINAFVRSEICFEMLGVEDLAEYDCKFDCILCLGVIYHRTNPLDCLRILKNALRARGELIIDTLIIEGEGEITLSPLSYAKMKNVYFIPSISAFKNWLVRAGFREIELLCVKKTTSEEQRKTAWSGGESLEDFLDKEDKNKTIEGYSAPTRAYFKAKI